jgi:hypothetical protein
MVEERPFHGREKLHFTKWTSAPAGASLATLKSICRPQYI